MKASTVLESNVRSLWGDESPVLAIDTATSAMTVALMKGRTAVREHNFRAERNHSIHLVPAIQRMLDESGLSARDLRGIAAGIGPGSYTGVRIGVTVAKTTAWALGLPTVGVSSLAALAWHGDAAARGEAADAELRLGSRESWADPDGGKGGRSRNSWYVPLLDARRGQVYTAVYGYAPAEERTVETMAPADTAADREPERWRVFRPDGIRPMQTWTEQLLAWAEEGRDGPGAPGRIVFVGGVGPFEGIIADFASRFGGETYAVQADVRASDLGELAWAMARRGQGTEAHALSPNYTQLAEAEAKLIAKQGGAACGGTE